MVTLTTLAESKCCAPFSEHASPTPGSSTATATAETRPRLAAWISPLILAASVVIALVGTSLSCLNTGVRVTYAMGKDTELPVIFGFLHGRFRTPHMGVIVLTVISALVGSYGVLNVNNLTQVNQGNQLRS